MSLILVEAKGVFDFLPQQDPSGEDLAVSAPEAEGYDVKSQGAIDMMEKLRYKSW